MADRDGRALTTGTPAETSVFVHWDAAPSTADAEKATLAELRTALVVIDWTVDQGATNIHAGNIPALDDKQALHANLTAFSGLTGVADRLAYFTGAGALALATFTAFGRSLAAAADAAAARTLTGAQALHANLTALSGLTGVADRLAYFTGAGAMALATFTSFGRSLVAAADAAAARTLTGAAPLASPAFTGNPSEAYADAGNKTGAASFAYGSGSWQKCVATGNITSVAVTGAPASGRVAQLTLEIHQDATGSRTIAWGAAFRFPGGTDYTLSTAATAIDIFTLISRDGGTVWYVFEGGKAWAA